MQRCRCALFFPIFLLLLLLCESEWKKQIMRVCVCNFLPFVPHDCISPGTAGAGGFWECHKRTRGQRQKKPPPKAGVLLKKDWSETGIIERERNGLSILVVDEMLLTVPSFCTPTVNILFVSAFFLYFNPIICKGKWVWVFPFFVHSSFDTLNLIFKHSSPSRVHGIVQFVNFCHCVGVFLYPVHHYPWAAAFFRCFSLPRSHS